MDRLRQTLANIQKQLGQLSVTQKLLIGTLCVLFLMTMFLVSQYAGSPTTVALLPNGTGEDQQKAAAFLGNKNISFKLASDGKIMVQPEQRYIALAAMTREQALPGDQKLMFSGVVSTTNWLESLPDKQTKQMYALQNELAMVISHIPGIDGASVFISRPPDSGGLGAAAKKTVAQLTVFPAGAQGLDQPTVNMLADFVANSVYGLDVRDVAVIDAKGKRSYRAVSADDLAMGGGGGGSYIEQVAKVEKRMQEKIAEHLRFIPDAIVSVNAIVDSAWRDTKTIKALNKGDGSVSMVKKEDTSTSTTNSGSKTAGEPFVSNQAMDINHAGGGGGGTGANTSTETSTVENEVKIGTQETHQRDAAGRPTKINVTVSVPREYVAAIAKQKKGGAAAGGATGAANAATSAEPTDADIALTFDSEVKASIEGMISPLVETEGAAVAGGTGGTAAQLVAGTVKAFLIPVSMVSASGAAGSGGGAKVGFMGLGGGSGSLTALMDSGLVKTTLLGVLALFAVGMMFMMVRKAGRSPTMPTAEELVGIPPALESGTDVVGEAIEGDMAMPGIEIDDDSLRTGKMLEEIGTLVKSNPQTAANVFNRWLTEAE